MFVRKRQKVECRKQIGINNIITEKKFLVKGFSLILRIFPAAKVIVFLKAAILFPQTGEALLVSARNFCYNGSKAQNHCAPRL